MWDQKEGSSLLQRLPLQTRPRPIGSSGLPRVSRETRLCPVFRDVRTETTPPTCGGSILLLLTGLKVPTRPPE